MNIQTLTSKKSINKIGVSPPFYHTFMGGTFVVQSVNPPLNMIRRPIDFPPNRHLQVVAKRAYKVASDEGGLLQPSPAWMAVKRFFVRNRPLRGDIVGRNHEMLAPGEHFVAQGLFTVTFEKRCVTVKNAIGEPMGVIDFPVPPSSQPAHLFINDKASGKRIMLEAQLRGHLGPGPLKADVSADVF